MRNSELLKTFEFRHFVYRISTFIKKNKSTIKNSILVWALFFLVDFLFGITITKVVITSYLKNTIFFIVAFYTVLWGVHIPFLPKKIFKAILAFFAIISILILLKYVFDFYIYKIDFPKEESLIKNYFGFEIWRITQVGFYSFAYWIYLNSLNEQKRRRYAEKKLLKTEIDFLKAQINPHFMFNTLNFVYNKVSNTNKESGDAIMSLTRLMRYSVESTRHEQSSLSNEVEMIEEYLLLQRLRFGSRLFVEFEKDGLLSLFIMPPLVLMSLVENAFKYGIIDDPEMPIKIYLKVNKDQLIFNCKNKKRLHFEDKETTAVGIDNIKRRLEIVYGDQYELDVEDATVDYEVKLTVYWKK